VSREFDMSNGIYWYKTKDLLIGDKLNGNLVIIHNDIDFLSLEVDDGNLRSNEKRHDRRL
jgi:hypothetical protein